MTVQDLIKDKDYDIIEWRITLPESVGCGTTLAGYCKSVNGELISLDGDSYCQETEITYYLEWTSKDGEKCLTIVEDVEWL